VWRPDFPCRVGSAVLSGAGNMRALIFVLFVLALGKVGLQAYIQREATETTIINAYSDRALAACGIDQQAAGTGRMRPSARRQRYESLPATTAPEPNARFELVIGQSDVNVRLWQTSHAQWSTRYSAPFVRVIIESATGPVICDYDINNARVYAVTRPQDGAPRRAGAGELRRKLSPAGATPSNVQPLNAG